MSALNGELYENSTDGNDTRQDYQVSPELLITPACYLYSFVVYTLVVGSLCILGTVGNLTAFVVFWRDNVKTSTSFLFQGLSFIDTIMLVCVFPIYAIKPFVDYSHVLTGWVHVEPFVLVYGLPLAFVAQTSTIWVTVLVGVNRYIAVCMPYQATRLCTVAQAKKQLAIVLVCAVLYNVPKFFESKIVFDTGADNTTVILPDHRELGKNMLYHIVYGNIFYLLFLLILPLLILTVLNIRLIKALKALRKKRAEMQSRQQQQDNNVTFVLIIVVLVFTLCQAPALVNQTLWNFLPDNARSCGGFQFYYSRISNTLVILNSAVNFLIYFFFNTRFRQVLIQSVCKREYKAIRATTTNVTTNETLL